MKILISHSGKQYVHQLLYAFEKNNIDYRFYTSFWYKPSKFPFSFLQVLPTTLKAKLQKELQKRYYEKIPSFKVVQFPFFELIRELSDKILKNKFSERTLFWRDRIHDKWVASKIKQESPNVVIGYEECCRDTFKEAKKKGIITILDLAQIHYNEIDTISKSYPSFGELYTNKALRNRINEIKEEELSLADYIICLSEFAKETLVKNGIPKSKIFVVSLGFDPGKFIPKKNYNFSEKLRVIFVSTITKRKGLDQVFKLQQELSDKIEVTLVGPVADGWELLKKMSDSVKRFDYVDHNELNVLLNESDLFVFPSYLDSWAMVVIEAMACGLPVVVSTNTGAKDAVINHQTGFIVPVGNYHELKEKLMFFIENKCQLETMGRLARKRAEDFTWDNYHKQIFSIIKEIESHK